jgi:peroxiredoxin
MNTTPLAIGAQAPDFTLPGVDGINHSLQTLLDGKKAVAVLFTCNHCPYVKGSEDRIKALQHDFVSKDVSIVCINSNNDQSHPDDSFEKMKERAVAKGFNFPYLRDQTQAVAREYGAQYTPEAFLFDHNGKLRYRGRIDDSPKDPANLKDPTLRHAIEALLAGKPIQPETTQAIGCSIKWLPEVAAGEHCRI